MSIERTTGLESGIPNDRDAVDERVPVTASPGPIPFRLAVRRRTKSLIEKDVARARVDVDRNAIVLLWRRAIC